MLLELDGAHIAQRRVPSAAQPDAVVIYVRAIGTSDGCPAEELFSCRIESQSSASGHGALTLASAAHAAALIDRFREGALAGAELRCPALTSFETVIASCHFENLRLSASPATLFPIEEPVAIR